MKSKEETDSLNKKCRELAEDELGKVTGGELGGMFGIVPYVFVVLTCGQADCKLCGAKPAQRAMANHLVNFHGYTREDAMAAIQEEYRSIQW